MRWIKNCRKLTVRMLICIVMSLGVLSTTAMGDDGPGISIDLAAGSLVVDSISRFTHGYLFTTKVTYRNQEISPFDTVHVETPAGEFLELEACEDGSCFLLDKTYRTLALFKEEHGNPDSLGNYVFIFNRGEPTEDSLTLVHPVTPFFTDLAEITHPMHKDEFAPLQMTVKWELQPYWRDYDGIIVELSEIALTEEGEPDMLVSGKQLYSSEVLSTRETSLDLEKEYAILEIDTKQSVTVKLVKTETGETITQNNAVTADYTITNFNANRVLFITTPDYYLGDGSSGTTCFINAAGSDSR